MTTCEDQADARELLSLRLPPDPSCVAVARRRLREVLGGLDGPAVAAVLDDATLVVSELVTNALLHAGSEITVAASYDDRSLLLRVTDDSPHVPRPRQYGEEARTGRGLLLVEELADDWGYVRQAVGKTVWVRWSLAAPSSDPTPGPVVDDLVVEPAADVLAVSLLELPLLLHAAWRAHAQALMRDLLLATLAGDDDERAPVQTHAETTDAIAVLDEHLPRPPLPVDGFESLAEVVEPDITLPVAVVPVPRGSVAHFATLDRASDAALALAARGELLTPPTLPEVQAFRRWVCGEVAGQAAGRAPTPFGVPPDTVTGSAVPPGWDPTPVRTATTAVVAADSDSRLVAVSRPAADLLGYADPVDLVGRRLVSIIPSRLRQSHVAGMTMYLLSDRRPLLGERVVVPALRRDGTEVDVELLIHEQPTATDRPVLVAELRPAGG